jgi:hypothetical protein
VDGNCEWDEFERTRKVNGNYVWDEDEDMGGNKPVCILARRWKC